MKKIDLIALDLDGTALNPQNQVSPATADAVRRARESGIHVVVSTGPHLRRGARLRAHARYG